MQQTEREDHATTDRDGAQRVARDHRTSRSAAAAPALVFGSLVLIVGTLLDWVDSRDAVDSAANGYQIPDGRVALGIGAALLVIGILMGSNKRVGSWFDADLLGTALSTFALVTIGALWLYLGSDERSPDIGLYVAAAGAAIAMVGSLMALLKSASDRATWDDDGKGDIGRNRGRA